MNENEISEVKLVRQLDKGRGVMNLYETNGAPKHVVISACFAPCSGPETYIFASDEEGDITDWCEMKGSLRGTLDHGEAIVAAGWKLAEAQGKAS